MYFLFQERPHRPCPDQLPSTPAPTLTTDTRTDQSFNKSPARILLARSCAADNEPMVILDESSQSDPDILVVEPEPRPTLPSAGTQREPTIPPLMTFDFRTPPQRPYQRATRGRARGRGAGIRYPVSQGSFRPPSMPLYPPTANPGPIRMAPPQRSWTPPPTDYTLAVRYRMTVVVASYS